MFPAYAEVGEDRGPLPSFLFGDARVGMTEDDPAHPAPDQGPGASEAGLMGHIGGLNRPVAESQSVLLRVAGVKAALAGVAGFGSAVGHPWQGPIETRRGNASIRPEQDGSHLEAAAGAQAAQLQGHVQKDFIF